MYNDFKSTLAQTCEQPQFQEQNEVEEEKSERAKHANYRDMVNYEALEVNFNFYKFTME